MVGVVAHLLEREPGLVQAPRLGERLHVPERADRERALFALQPVGRRLDVVPVDEAVGDRQAGDRVERREPPCRRER